MAEKPHDSWAEVYDYAYEASFGSMYRSLTKRTLKFLNEHARGGSKILDVGAGTGRLSIPLRDMGFDVTAVDASSSMLNILSKKDIDHKISKKNISLQELNLEEKFDVVLCVFSVFCYITDRVQLQNSLRNISHHVAHDGFAFIDVPSLGSFSGFEYVNQNLNRVVNVDKVEGHDDLFEYHEFIKILESGDEKQYEDSFFIKYWSAELILNELKSAGMRMAYDASLDFSGSGASYFKFTW